jgi:phosphoribosylaminoimidazole-succinocarboxamide synthase
MKAYEEGKRDFCGNHLPEKLLPYQKLPSPIITPTTKAEAFHHDLETTADELVRNEIVTEKEWITIIDMAYKLFLFGQKEYESKGWILVDTKYEFGRTPDGQLIVIDEIHTPDSSRIWIKDTYLERFKMGQPPEMLDKQHVRRWLQEHGFEGQGKVPKVPTKLLLDLGQIYLDVAERLIGKPLLVPETPTKPVFS